MKSVNVKETVKKLRVWKEGAIDINIVLWFSGTKYNEKCDVYR